MRSLQGRKALDRPAPRTRSGGAAGAGNAAGVNCGGTAGHGVINRSGRNFPQSADMSAEQPTCHDRPARTRWRRAEQVLLGDHFGNNCDEI